MAEPLISEVMVPGPESPAAEFLAEKQQMIAARKENWAQAREICRSTQKWEIFAVIWSTLSYSHTGKFWGQERS